jgi:peptidoglycan/LPS O-acetylase OafA/YrhL
MAAVLVVLFHIPKWNPILEIGIINNGYLMVELFFVLSGFVIFNAYSQNINSKNDLLRFQFLRLGRLYPVHILFLAVFFLFELSKYFAQLKLNIVSPNTQPFHENSMSALVQHLILIQAIGPTGNAQTFNIPAWSISVEFYTYLIFGLSVLFFRNARPLFFTMIAMLSLALLVSENTFGARDLFKCLAGFYIGCLTADFTKKAKIVVPNFFSLAGVALIIIFLQQKTTEYFDVAIYFLTSALIISLILSESGTLKKVFNLKLLIFFGEISYFVYMSHTAVIWIVNQVLRVALKKPEIAVAGGRITPQLSQVESVAATLVIVASVLIISYIVYNCLEKPMRKKSRLVAAQLFNKNLISGTAL